ncbi:hypothetical protein DFJ74DRAFT_647903 [Hyaloraphidium curvatum]|nr:hypothetical protein DFJ74DRAFT_647903 [Hyaloraphidium curvatum]
MRGPPSPVLVQRMIGVAAGVKPAPVDVSALPVYEPDKPAQATTAVKPETPDDGEDEDAVESPAAVGYVDDAEAAPAREPTPPPPAPVSLLDAIAFAADTTLKKLEDAAKAAAEAAARAAAEPQKSESAEDFDFLATDVAAFAAALVSTAGADESGPSVPPAVAAVAPEKVPSNPEPVMPTTVEPDTTEPEQPAEAVVPAPAVELSQPVDEHLQPILAFPAELEDAAPGARTSVWIDPSAIPDMADFHASPVLPRKQPPAPRARSPSVSSADGSDAERMLEMMNAAGSELLSAEVEARRGNGGGRRKEREAKRKAGRARSRSRSRSRVRFEKGNRVVEELEKVVGELERAREEIKRGPTPSEEPKEADQAQAGQLEGHQPEAKVDTLEGTTATPTQAEAAEPTSPVAPVVADEPIAKPVAPTPEPDDTVEPRTPADVAPPSPVETRAPPVTPPTPPPTPTPLPFQRMAVAVPALPTVPEERPASPIKSDSVRRKGELTDLGFPPRSMELTFAARDRSAPRQAQRARRQARLSAGRPAAPRGPRGAGAGRGRQQRALAVPQDDPEGREDGRGKAGHARVEGRGRRAAGCRRRGDGGPAGRGRRRPGQKGPDGKAEKDGQQGLSRSSRCKLGSCTEGARGSGRHEGTERGAERR